MTPRVLLRGLAGALTAGLAVLLVVLIGSWVAGVAAGTRGPGGLMLGGHVAAVCAAVVLQRVADRRGDGVGAAAAVGVLAVTAVVVIVFWWS
ncbi:hypothetical protein [Pseudonocardia spinosispora]|uniref:hypothetical protein n=1 Tax=Pseudonocardia spinosispora TaxID=103441 RepID=UPI000408B598|nr:hypothetical protein [Pseudonocardia spinosispora]